MPSRAVRPTRSPSAAPLRRQGQGSGRIVRPLRNAPRAGGWGHAWPDRPGGWRRLRQSSPFRARGRAWRSRRRHRPAFRSSRGRGPPPSRARGAVHPRPRSGARRGRTAAREQPGVPSRAHSVNRPPTRPVYRPHEAATAQLPVERNRWYARQREADAAIAGRRRARSAGPHVPGPERPVCRPPPSVTVIDSWPAQR